MTIEKHSGAEVFRNVYLDAVPSLSVQGLSDDLAREIRKLRPHLADHNQPRAGSGKSWNMEPRWCLTRHKRNTGWAGCPNTKVLDTTGERIVDQQSSYTTHPVSAYVAVAFGSIWHPEEEACGGQERCSSLSPTACSSVRRDKESCFVGGSRSVSSQASGDLQFKVRPQTETTLLL
jgi:hypothetical protein